MADRIDPDNVNFVLLDLARLFRSEFERRIGSTGLGMTPAEARVLAHLARCGPVRQHVLAERIGVAPMSLTGFLDRLEERGLVARSPDLQDRRAKQVALTEAAEPALGKIAEIGREIRIAARRGISDGDWAAFGRVAQAARANLAEARAQPGSQE